MRDRSPLAVNGQPPTANFVPAWFIRNPHAQTVWGRIARPRQLVRLRREVIVTIDESIGPIEVQDIDVLALHEVLERLASIDPRYVSDQRSQTTSRARTSRLETRTKASP